MRRYDVLVVGGGPVGCLVAKIVSQQGFSVGLFEEHEEVGVPVRCAGLVSPRVMDLAGASNTLILNKISGARIYSPGGHSLSIGGKKIQAFSIDRAQFDRDLANQAASAGAKLWLGNRVAGINKTNIVLKTGEEIGFQFLVGADGPTSLVARSCNLIFPQERIYGINAEFSLEHDSSMVDIFFGKSISPGFFSWVIPAGEKVKVGLGVSPGYKPRKFFMAFLKKLGIKEQPHYHVGIIPLNPIERLYRNNIILVGDAAGQVKPSSGGGLYPGLVGASHCGNALIQALEKGDNLSSYYSAWHAEIGKEIKRGLFLRRLFLRIDDTKIDKIFQILSAPDLLDIINKYGDIDYPSKVLLNLIKHHPGILRYFPSLFFK